MPELIRFLAYVFLVLLGTVAVGLGIAWVFGGACKLGGPDDPRRHKASKPFPPEQILILHEDGTVEEEKPLQTAIRRAHDSRRASSGR